MDIEKLLEISISTALEAGKATLKYYGRSIPIELKDDNSPLTKADLEANSIINFGLINTKIPVLSEENTNEAYEVRKKWDYLWIVDPIDGTKEFINTRKEYTINIALAHQGSPILGVVYTPVLDEMYFGTISGGAFKVEEASSINSFELHSWYANAIKLPCAKRSDKFIIVASKNHRNAETDNYIKDLSERIGPVEVVSYGSSLKLCKVAEGAADFYPRIAPTMEWDTAAGHVIAVASGCKVVDSANLQPLIYNKEDLRNPSFLIYQPDLEKHLKIKHK